MIKKQNFIALMEALKKEQDLQYDMATMVNKYCGYKCYFWNSNLFDAIMEILYDIFGNIENLDYWVYNLNFGKEVDESDEIKTVEELYNYLMESYKN